MLIMVTSFHVQCILQPPLPQTKFENLNLSFSQSSYRHATKIQDKACKYPWKSIFHQNNLYFAKS